MKHLFTYFFAVIFITGIFSSCKKNSEEPIAIDKSYFPLQSGKYIIYDVDSIGYSDFFDSTFVSKYQIKEEIDSAFIDNEGNAAYRIYRSRRNTDTDSWVITDVWSANLTDYTAEKVEENLRFIKQYFPIQINRQWYGNAKIQTTGSLSFLDGWKYEYTEIHAPLTINSLYFDSTITVTQHNEVNFIAQKIYIEKYAKNVGLIYKFEDSLSIQQDTSGRIVTMMVKEFN
ncbi:MAG: hypothetical protein LH473_11400 [Chitinophagales bacterium]|nr:hypothetical protein [Chitinophagales bacterium]